jgi:hypothetical protein
MRAGSCRAFRKDRSWQDGVNGNPLMHSRLKPVVPGLIGIITVKNQPDKFPVLWKYLFGNAMASGQRQEYRNALNSNCLFLPSGAECTPCEAVEFIKSHGHLIRICPDNGGSSGGSC